MLKTIAGLQGVTILSKDTQKKVTGKGKCGVLVGGVWRGVVDTNGDGKTLDDVKELRAYFPTMRWCCDSCPWNR
ncbi:MAG: hypothetical protein IM564_04915 [Chitinophagaceae bacterium]|nr:hypothetical protein [Chitinophagaceae bacterium]